MLNPSQYEKIEKTFHAIKVWFDGFEEVGYDHIKDVMHNAETLKQYQHIYPHSKILYHAAQRLSIAAGSLNHLQSSNNASEDLHWMALREFDHDYGHLIIRPETLSDKLNEFFETVELDFDNSPAFSAKYYLTSNQPAKAFEFATPQRLSLIEKIDDLVMEVKSHTLIAQCNRQLNPADCINLLSVISHL